jgi:cysteine desulfurase
MIYLDNNATTQVAPEVFEEMAPFLKTSYGNPSSAHEFGRSVRRAVETARERVATLLGAASPDEIVFTSSGTESDNWAIRGAIEAQPGKRHIVTTTVEHEAVRKTCEAMARLGLRVTSLEVDENGELDLDQVRNSVTKDTAIVSVMLANNETGILFPVESIADIVKEMSDALVHVDAVNAAGKVRISLENSNIDLLSISAHKFHGPKGVGALYIRRGVDIPGFIFGGGQEGASDRLALGERTCRACRERARGPAGESGDQEKGRKVKNCSERNGMNGSFSVSQSKPHWRKHYDVFWL